MAAVETTFTPGRRIDIPSVPNLRDLGGYAVAGGGSVRTGQPYRSVELNHLQGADLKQFAKLGIRTVFDLRTEAERAAEPDVVPEGIEQVVCDVMADSQSAAPAQLLTVLADPALAESMFGEGKAVGLFERGYREIISLPSAIAAYHEFFSKIAQDAHRPALFHCTTGKDRTGWAAAATLLLLGASEHDVFDDYELSNRDLLPALKPIFEHFTAAGSAVTYSNGCATDSLPVSPVGNRLSRSSDAVVSGGNAFHLRRMPSMRLVPTRVRLRGRCGCDPVREH